MRYFDLKQKPNVYFKNIQESGVQTSNVSISMYNRSDFIYKCQINIYRCRDIGKII